MPMAQPYVCGKGDSFDIESEISSVTSHGSFMSVVRAAKLAADQVSHHLYLLQHSKRNMHLGACTQAWAMKCCLRVNKAYQAPHVTVVFASEHCTQNLYFGFRLASQMRSNFNLGCRNLMTQFAQP